MLEQSDPTRSRQLYTAINTGLRKRGNSIGDKGCRWLSQIPLPNIKHIGIRCNTFIKDAIMWCSDWYISRRPTFPLFSSWSWVLWHVCRWKPFRGRRSATSIQTALLPQNSQDGSLLKDIANCDLPDEEKQRLVLAEWALDRLSVGSWKLEAGGGLKTTKHDILKRLIIKLR